MWRYVVRRLLAAIGVLIGASFLVFLGMRLVPGDPATAILGSRATPEALAALREELGLNRPFYVQYLIWLGKMVHGDFGTSIALTVPVTKVLVPKFGNTLILGAGALAIAVPIGAVIGVLSGYWQLSLFDRAGQIFALFGASVPQFWLALVLVAVFSLNLGWFPVSGMYDMRGDGGRFDLLRHLVLPAVATSTIPMAVIARLVRASIIEIMHQDYVRTARAKGLRERRVMFAHALRNALPQFINITALQVGFLLSGALFTEVIFSWPGIGQALYNAVVARDVPMVQGAVFVTTLVFVLANLAADMAQAALDPKT
ncbi:MAG: ABC transporter permease, partial [Chloroflexota bacterium]|nr:ABC transporter permease [Chloroflexota bacterium]